MLTNLTKSIRAAVREWRDELLMVALPAAALGSALLWLGGPLAVLLASVLMAPLGLLVAVLIPVTAAFRWRALR